MKKTLATTMIAIITTIVLFSSVVEGKGIPQLKFYRQLRKEKNLIRILDVNDQSAKKPFRVLSGNGDLVIEITYGVVMNKEGDGVILNTKSKRYNYISYRHVNNAHKGDVIMTAVIYPPNREAYDDDIGRYDWVIDTNYPTKRLEKYAHYQYGGR